MRRLQTFCAPFIVLVGLSTELGWAMLPAKDLSANLTIQPSAPTKSWPAANESNALAPNYTATISINVVATEKIGNLNYRLTSGPTVKTTCTDPNIIWTGVANSNNYSITNTAADTATASIALSCVWSPEKNQTPPSGKGSGRGGSGRKSITGTADANVQLLDSVVDWVFDRPAQWADGSKPIKFETTLTDSNGFGLERWSLIEFVASAAAPAAPSWTFTSTPATGSSQSGEVKSNTPSKGKVQIKYNDGSAEARLSTQELAFIKLKLVKVEFSGSGNRTIVSDNAATNYAGSHWSDPNGDGNPADGNAYPVAYVSDTKLTISPEWQLEPTVTGVSLKIKATGPDSISVSEVNASVSGNDVKLATAAAATNVFEKEKVRYWDEFKLAFEASFQGENEWTTVGESKNQLYVTWKAPLSGLTLYHTIIDVGCRNADGLTTEANIFSAIWSDFKSPSSGTPAVLPARAPGMAGPLQPFTYYGNSARPYDTPNGLTDLLSQVDGRCGSFQEFFIAVLAAQNISASPVVVYAPKVGLSAALADYNTTYGAALPTAFVVGRAVFFVKHWTLSTTARFNSVSNTGVPAQGNADPLGAFGDHALVSWDGKYYDPSYGTGPFNTLIEWEDASLDGFGIQFIHTSGNASDFLYWTREVDKKGTQETTLTP